MFKTKFLTTLLILCCLSGLNLKVEASSGKNVYSSGAITIQYNHSDQLDKFIEEIQPGALDCALNKVFLGKGCNSPCVSVAEFLDVLRQRVQVVLGMPDSKVKITFILHENQKDLEKALSQVGSDHPHAPAFFDPKTKTIHLRTDYITMGILGHEIAHAVLADYFVIHPTHDIGEILSQHVEKKLTAQNFTICISRKV